MGRDRDPMEQADDNLDICLCVCVQFPGHLVPREDLPQAGGDHGQEGTPMGSSARTIPSVILASPIPTSTYAAST